MQGRAGLICLCSDQVLQEVFAGGWICTECLGGGLFCIVLARSGM